MTGATLGTSSRVACPDSDAARRSLHEVHMPIARRSVIDPTLNPSTVRLIKTNAANPATLPAVPQ
jgi:hypothetical protein